ncbi:MAG: ferric reductase-like transmembrane domain-containing protein, partial [Dehalococcoidia bacterium]
MLLYITLALGPMARFFPRFWLLLPYRRELGIWFGISAIVHTVIILDGWARWDVLQFMGYQFVPQLGRMVRLESGFGMANLLGLLAVLLALPLMATSADWAMRALGGASWKFLHYGAYTIFYLVVMHTAYFLYIHYTASFHRAPPEDPNWFQIPFAVLTVALITLQAGAFFNTVRRQRRGASRRAARTNFRNIQPGLDTERGLESPIS